MLKDKIKMNLQLLADDNNADTDDQTENAEANETEKEETTETKPDKTEKEAKYTDEDVDRILEKKFKKWQEKKDKEVSEAKKLANMTAQERAEHQRDELEKELNKLREANTLSEMSKTARGILRESNIDLNDDLLSVLVTKEAETTKKNVESFVEMFDKAVEKAVNEKLKGKPPKKGKTKQLTKEEINNVKDRVERQKLIAENLELYTN